MTATKGTTGMTAPADSEQRTNPFLNGTSEPESTAGQSAARRAAPVTGENPHDRPVRILGIGGTTSAKSWSLVPLEAALAKVRDLGGETTLASVYDLNLPLFHTEWRLEDYPPTLAWLLDEVRHADGLILCSPTYHGTISGAIKNVLDTLIFLGWDTPPYLAGKPVGLMSYGGMTSMGVLQALTNCVRGLKGISVPTHVAVPEDSIDRENVVLESEKIERRLDLMVAEIVSFASHLRGRHAIPAITAPYRPQSSNRGQPGEGEGTFPSLGSPAQKER
jgi:FMN reductase